MTELIRQKYGSGAYEADDTLPFSSVIEVSKAPLQSQVIEEMERFIGSLTLVGKEFPHDPVPYVYVVVLAAPLTSDRPDSLVQEK